MRNLALGIFLAVGTNVHAELNSTYPIALRNYQNDNYQMSVYSRDIQSNGDAEPGLFFSAVKSKSDIPYNKKSFGNHKAPNRESQLTEEHMASTYLPMHIVFNKPKEKEAAAATLKALRDPDKKFQFTVDGTVGQDRFTKKTEPARGDRSKDSDSTGELVYTVRERVIPESAVTVTIIDIKDKSKRKIPLSEFIDEVAGRPSLKTSLKRFTGMFGKKETEDDKKSVNDSNLQGFPKELLAEPKPYESNPAGNGSKK